MSDVNFEALPAVLVPPVRDDPYCCPYAPLLRPCGPVINTWTITATYTVRLASGSQAIRPLVAQAIGTTLGRLMVMEGNLYPYVTTAIASDRRSSGVPRSVYAVRVTYPTMISGHKRLPDGTICDQVTPVAVMVSDSDKAHEAALATAQTHDTTNPGSWNAQLIAAANSLMTDDVLVHLTFSDFAVDT
jgi:hypothetical protein